MPALPWSKFRHGLAPHRQSGQRCRWSQRCSTPAHQQAGETESYPDVASYPANELFALKAQHEQWVTQKLEEKSISYSFAELEVLAKYLVSSTASAQTTSSFSLLKIDEKIKKNSLIDVQGYITMGLSSNFTIADYLNRHPDPLFAAKLTNIMAQKYRDLKSNGLDNYEIFDELWTFASGNNSDFSYKAAGLGILTYFFEKCEVFEK